VAIEPYTYTVASKDTMLMTFGAPITASGRFLGTAGTDVGVVPGADLTLDFTGAPVPVG
jgi:hypothetical protein